MTIRATPVIFRTLLCGAVAVLTGCLARPHLNKQSFMFGAPSRPTVAASGDRVLRIRSVQVAPPFEGRTFVYRTGEFAYDRDPYAEFMVSPAEALVSPIAARFRQAGVFRAVVEAGSALKPDTVAEIHVDQLYGDFQPSNHAAAVLAMRFVFLDYSNGVSGKVLLRKSYTRDIPLKASTAEAVIEGWNQALAEVLDSALQDFGQAGAEEPKR